MSVFHLIKKTFIHYIHDDADFKFSRNIQHFHINGNGWCDIGYSFLVGGDGNIYEGKI